MLRRLEEESQQMMDELRHARDIQMGLVPSVPLTIGHGEVDYERGVLRFTNAGHSFPMLRRRDGSLEELTEGGLPLGLFDDAEYKRGEVAFAPGDALLLYSDSIYKANDSTYSMFGADRLRSLWQSYSTLPSGEIIDCLLKEVEESRGSARQIGGQSDALTAVVVGPRNDR